MINVYALTMTSANEEKEAFYQVLASVMDHVNIADKLLILVTSMPRLEKAKQPTVMQSEVWKRQQEF